MPPRRSKSAPNGPKTAQEAPKTPQEASQESPGRRISLIFRWFLKVSGLSVFSAFRCSQMAQEASKTAPRRPKTPPRAPQDGSKTAQEAPKTAQERPKTAPRGAQEGDHEPKIRAIRLKCAPGVPKRPPRGPKRRPRDPQEAPRGPQETQKRPQEARRWPPRSFKTSSTRPLTNGPHEIPSNIQEHFVVVVIVLLVSFFAPIYYTLPSSSSSSSPSSSPSSSSSSSSFRALPPKGAATATQRSPRLLQEAPRSTQTTQRPVRRSDEAHSPIGVGLSRSPMYTLSPCRGSAEWRKPLESTSGSDVLPEAGLRRR